MSKHFKQIKRGLFLITFVFCVSFLKAQFHPWDMTITDGHIYYKLDTGYYDTELKVGCPGALVKKTVYSKRTNNMVVEIIRISDSSVAYIRYDTKRNVIEKGIVKSNKEEKPHIDFWIQIPDMANDPDGFKGLTKDTVSESIPPSIKVGYWVEEESVPIYSKSGAHTAMKYMAAGYYENGERFGKWEFGVPYHQMKGDPEDLLQTQFIGKYIFYGGRKDSTLPAISREAFNLSGKWYVKAIFSMDSILLCRNSFLSGNQGFFLDFYTTHSFIFNYYGPGGIVNDIPEGDWVIHDGILTLNGSGSKVNYRIENVKWTKDSNISGSSASIKEGRDDGLILRRIH